MSNYMRRPKRPRVIRVIPGYLSQKKLIVPESENNQLAITFEL